MKTALILAASVAALSLAFSAHAQDIEADSEITVTGQRALPQAAAKRFVSAVTSAAPAQLARFHDPVCPLAMGLPEQHKRIVERRIRKVAAEVGASIDNDANCKANIVLMMASDGRALMDDVIRNRPGWIAGLRPFEVDRLRSAPGPVWSWQVTSIRNEFGQGAGVHGDDLDGAQLRVGSVSHLKKGTRQHIDGALLIVENAAATGMTLNQLADYAAMRGLARTKAVEGAGPETILGLFAQGDGTKPRELTSIDVGYLRALYSSNGQLDAVRENARIARALSDPQS